MAFRASLRYERAGVQFNGDLVLEMLEGRSESAWDKTPSQDRVGSELGVKSQTVLRGVQSSSTVIEDNLTTMDVRPDFHCEIHLSKPG